MLTGDIIIIRSPSFSMTWKSYRNPEPHWFYHGLWANLREHCIQKDPNCSGKVAWKNKEQSPRNSSGAVNSSAWWGWLPTYFAKDCLLTGQEQACTRITWLFVCSSSPCQNWPNTQKNGCWVNSVDCTLNDHIQSETLFQTRPIWSSQSFA